MTVDDEPVADLLGSDLARRVAVVAQETPSDLPITVADMCSWGGRRTAGRRPRSAGRTTGRWRPP